MTNCDFGIFAAATRAKILQNDEARTLPKRMNKYCWIRCQERGVLLLKKSLFIIEKKALLTFALVV